MPNTVPVYGAYLGGESVHHLQLPQQHGCLMLGNEAYGTSAELTPIISRKIIMAAVGSFGSLHGGIAAAVICDNLTGLSAIRQNT